MNIIGSKRFTIISTIFFLCSLIFLQTRPSILHNRLLNNNTDKISMFLSESIVKNYFNYSLLSKEDEFNSLSIEELYNGDLKYIPSTKSVAEVLKPDFSDLELKDFILGLEPNLIYEKNDDITLKDFGKIIDWDSTVIAYNPNISLNQQTAILSNSINKLNNSIIDKAEDNRSNNDSLNTIALVIAIIGGCMAIISYIYNFIKWVINFKKSE